MIGDVYEGAWLGSLLGGLPPSGAETPTLP